MIAHVPPGTDVFIVEMSYSREGQRWRANTSYDVMTTDAGRAIVVATTHAAAQGCQEIRVHVVRRRGQGKLLIDPDLAASTLPDS